MTMPRIILNPAYLLRQDGNRVIILSQNESDWGVREWFSYIHPYQAMLLSFFKGREDAETEIARCAEFFNLSPEKIKAIISPFTDNVQWAASRKKDGSVVSFPQHTLLTIGDNSPLERDVYYEPSDFKFLGTPDYGTIRLAYPVSINMELTMRCYVDCCYCYANRNLADKSMMSKDEILGFIRQAKADGALSVDINGGEVLLHPHIKDILKELVDNGYKPLVSTKMPITPDMADYIQQLGIKRVQISLDTVNPDISREMVKSPVGYIDSLRKSLEHLSEIGLPTNINVVLTKHNSDYTEIRKLLDFASSFSAVKLVRFNMCGYSLYRPGYTDIALSTAKSEEITEYIHSLQTHYDSLDIRSSGFDSEDVYACKSQEKFNSRAICTGNTRGVVILPNGDVTICEELYDHPAFIIGNIRKNTLKEIWNSDKALSLFNMPLKSQSDSVCGQCESADACRKNEGVCWKTILMAYGMDNWDYPDPRCPKAPAPYHKFYTT